MDMAVLKFGILDFGSSVLVTFQIPCVAWYIDNSGTFLRQENHLGIICTISHFDSLL